MLIVTNRNTSKIDDNGIGDERAFGDKLNESNPNEVQLATVERNSSNKWKVQLLDKTTLCATYRALRKALVATKKNCVFFIHGYNQTFEKNLHKIYEVQELHDVEVIAFSWPSNMHSGVSVDEYRQARINSLASVGALSATLTELGNCNKGEFNTEDLRNEEFNFKFSLMAFSLGNFLFQNYVNNFSNYDVETRLFDNIVLCQADVDNLNHKQWVDRIKLGKRVYVTINENDYALDASEKIVGQNDRLGAMPAGLDSDSATYIDFTHGQDVVNTHNLFKLKLNKHVRTIFTELLNGRRGENAAQLEYKSESNSYQFRERYHQRRHEK